MTRNYRTPTVMGELRRSGVSPLPAINALVSARTVAIVGASDDVSKVGGRALLYLRTHGYSGAIYPVNGRGGIVQGLEAWPSMTDLPTPVDTAGSPLP